MEEGDEPPTDLKEWPDDEAKYITYGGGEGDHGYDEGPEKKLGPSSLERHEDGSVTIDGEEVDNPDEYKHDETVKPATETTPKSRERGRRRRRGGRRRRRRVVRGRVERGRRLDAPSSRDVRDAASPRSVSIVVETSNLTKAGLRSLGRCLASLDAQTVRWPTRTR